MRWGAATEPFNRWEFRGSTTPSNIRRESHQERPLGQGKSPAQEAVKKIQVEMVEQALDKMGHQPGEPVDGHEHHGKGDPPGMLGVGDPGLQQPRQAEVGVGRHHHAPHHPHQDRQLLKQAPVIASQGDQAQKNNDPQV